MRLADLSGGSRPEVSVRLRVFAALSLVLVAVGCGRNTTPASPDSAGAGAVVTGSVISSGSSAVAARPLGVTAVTAGLSVSIAGTNLTSGVDSTGHFAFQDVPGGDRQLHFTGPGVDAQVGISSIQTSETINLSVSLSGSSATIETQSRSSGSDRDIEGRVEGLPPVTPPAAFTAASKIGRAHV